MAESVPDEVEEQCVDCGTWFMRKRGRRAHRCFDCRLKRQLALQYQIGEQSGPLYQDWLHRWRAGVERTVTANADKAEP